MRSILGESPTPRRPAPRSSPGAVEPRHWLRTTAIVVILATLLLAVAGISFLDGLPAADDAPAHVAARLEAHGGLDVGMPPPAKVGEAVVAVEDRRFYQHHGIDSLGLLRAAWYVVTSGSPRGGATITEQLAGLLYVADDHTVRGELRKVGMAVKLERRYSKSQILDMYLNAVYLGDGQWGVAKASRTYFHRSV